MLEGLKMLQYFFKVYPPSPHKEDGVLWVSWGPAAAWSPFMAILEINILGEQIFIYFFPQTSNSPKEQRFYLNTGQTLSHRHGYTNKELTRREGQEVDKDIFIGQVQRSSPLGNRSLFAGGPNWVLAA